MKTRLTPIAVVPGEVTPGGARVPVRVRGERVVAVLGGFRVQGRWWARETRRRYVRVRLEGGAVLDLFEEEERWYLAREFD